ncbi:hypothetical protein C8046_16800 [Serinibacter arcticus]|uniref:Uncharacterized protein n=1 Tax=Serinibacter arcticus TaxID=1655435 RepID=A0A2U1ZYJ4_9MICO|nr:hypothetical protein C8046_16800 [Serinibacter arcticus]
MLSGLGLAACASTSEGQAPDDVVCPAIGWFNTLTVTLEGDSAGVDDMKLCLGEDCYPKDEPATDGSDLADSVGVEREATRSRWTFALMSHAPDEVTVRTYDASGTMLTDDLVAPGWRRTGGSEECGGPHFGRATVRL